MILVANRKGGTGKTTVAVNLAAELVRTHGPTLLVDMDPQGHAGLGLGVIAKAGEPTVHDLFTGRAARLEEAVRPTSIAGLDIVPADRGFAGDFTVREPRALAAALEPLRARYAAIVLDTPPTVDAALVNALAAADRCLVPTVLHWLALDGVSQFARLFFRVAAYVNPALGPLAIVPVLVDTRSTMQRAVLAELIRRYGPERIFRAIRVDVSLAEAFGQGVPVRAYRPASRGAADFERLCGEISSIGKTYSPPL
ncbi:ParA family protein [Blastochloris sulfoviridis]|uniref:ParA family protein n=1 Tax=Blastochloris sulfoviridis TaxID=50712 RepID=UPI0014787744|nr:ParA family protein [Blastochloris sulfoviridis]